MFIVHTVLEKSLIFLLAKKGDRTAKILSDKTNKEYHQSNINNMP